MAQAIERRSRRSLATVLLLLGAALTLTPILAPSAVAAGTTYLSGNACASSTTPTWVNTTTYVLAGNVTVPVGCTLTIQSGTVIKADPQVRLYLNGVLEANGTATSYISFDANRTSQVWGGVQFNKTSQASYLQYASLHMVDHGVRVVGTPLFWGPTLSHLDIDHAIVGVEFQGANATLSWSRINYTTMAVHASDGGYGGYPIIVANTITTVLSNPAIAIYATNLVQPTIQSNWITWVNGTDGSAGGALLTTGQDGGAAVGILVTGGTWPIVAGNTISQVRGGRGGAGGSPLISGNGGRGGKGGDASGIVMANAQNSRAQTNDITGVVGGHGGNGGDASGLGTTGGAGGAGGTAIAMEALDNTVTGWWFYNDAIGISGGSAGDGGGGPLSGAGGSGGAAYAHFFLQNMAGNASNNLAQTLVGGYGGNGSVGGVGGEVGGVWMAGMGGSGIVGSNTIAGLTGGQGGAGAQPTAGGGNATALLLIGDAGKYNTTTVRGNTINGITGGVGGVGSRGGSNGGVATAIGAVYTRVVSSGNTIQAITGGQGGSTGPTWTNGQGGSATAYAVALTPSSSSSQDRVQSVTKGLPGSGGTNPSPAQAIGFYVLGNATLTSVASLTNDTFASIGERDLFLENYTRTTALNTTFAPSTLYVGPAANLTVQNFLAVKVLWPNNVTAVAGARVAVADSGVEVYNRTSSTGNLKWIVVTNRVYIDSAIPLWNTTRVTVSYLTYTFGNNPRTVNMTTSQTQYFTMIDRTPPTTAMTALSAFTTTRTFTLHYSYSDGFGAGVTSVTIWDRVNGSTWNTYAIISVTGSGSGQISFTAASDGLYEFAATAIDAAANQQTPVPPTANQTWTIVDTTKPASQATALPAWETSLSFLVSWGPSPGTTDIASYTVQYNSTGTWVTWLSSTLLTSSTFTATSQTVYQFRTLARDFAGNVEVKTGNDTWTLVDSVVPTSAVSALPSYETIAVFSIAWGPTAGTSDVANYTVQVRTDGGAWVTWLSGVTNTSATFTGVNGHWYAFRSLATDVAGNVETKAGNDTWTTVDTSPPGSLVASLPSYETSLSFTVSWSPEAGVTDIASYRIEYNHGAGWVSWLGDTTATSATFSIVALGIVSPQGNYAFRSVATDRAGNVETKTGNDTWTVVDTIVPTSLVSVLPAYETTAAFTVSWNPTGVTSDVQGYTLQVSADGAAWVSWFSGATNRSATFTGVNGHRYAFRSLATDVAGNVETKSGNDTWTIVDTTPPSSSMNALPLYETALTFPVNWGPAPGTADVATCDVQLSLDGGTWTTWLSGVNNRSAVFSAANGHRYAFRSLATDVAGNAEAKSGNDTFTFVDATLPTVVLDAPEGAGVDPAATLTVTFSEPMDEGSVEQAFSLSPSIDGAFSWNAAGTVLTFTPARALSAGTSYTVVITPGAKDLAGNSLGTVKTFTFSTAGSSTAAGSSFGDWWPLLLAVVVGAIVAVLVLLRRRGSAAQELASKPAAPASPAAGTEIDDIFLLYKDGILIKHETLRLRPDIDTDILSGMLTAVQQFVKDSFQSEDEGELNEITVGQMHLHIGRGKWLILAARVAGGDVTTMNEQIRKAIQDMEDHHWDQLEDWDGDMALSKVLGPYLKRLIRGDYT